MADPVAAPGLGDIQCRAIQHLLRRSIFSSQAGYDVRRHAARSGEDRCETAAVGLHAIGSPLQGVEERARLLPDVTSTIPITIFVVVRPALEVPAAADAREVIDLVGRAAELAHEAESL